MAERHIKEIGEQSESDKGILVQAVKSLPKVASIQIDTFWSFESPCEFRCGGHVVDKIYNGDYEPDPGCAVDDLVFQALIDADKHIGIAIYLDFHPQKEHPTGDLSNFGFLGRVFIPSSLVGFLRL